MNIRTFFRRLKNPELDLIDFMNLAYLGKKPSSFHGHTQLDLLRDGKVVHRIERDNTITGWIGNALSAGNFFNQVATDKIYPLSQWFSGCYLTDSANDATTSILAGNTNIVAQAGDDAYSGNNTKRGSFNSIESGSGVNNGKCFIRNVWDWNTSQGNCAQGQSIASVCLTRGNLGKLQVYDSQSAAVADGETNTFFEKLSSADFSLVGSPNIIDYENERAYKVTYDESSTITVVEYFINTKMIHLFGTSASAISSTTHTINQTLADFSGVSDGGRFALGYDQTNQVIHVFTWTEAGKLNDYSLDLSNNTASLSTKTYQGITLGYVKYYGNNRFIQAVLMDNGYYYISTSTKIYKLNMTNAADATEYNSPCTSARDAIIRLPNGDWYQPSYSDDYTIYHHNGSYKCVYGSIGKEGGWLSSATAVMHDSSYSLAALFPFVSTVNNLASGSEVRKTSDLSMKLTYTIEEA